MSVRVLFVVDGEPTGVVVPDGEVISEYNGVVDVEDSSGKTVGIFAASNVIGVVVEPEAEEAKGTWQVRTPRQFDNFAQIPEGVMAMEREDQKLNRNRPMGLRRREGVIEAAADPNISGSWIPLSNSHRQFAAPFTEQVGFEHPDE